MSLLKVVFFFFFFSIFGFSSVNVLENIQLKNNELVLHFNKTFHKSRVKKMTLTNPHRQVFDFKNVRLKDKYISKKFPKYIRIAQFKSNTVRIVIENKKSYKCMPYTSMLSLKELHIPLGQKSLNSKNLHNGHASAPKKIIKINKPRRSAKSINDIFSDVEMVNINEKRKYTRDNEKKNNFPVIYNQSNNYDLIVIDAGHGGHDSGASCGGKHEKNLVLTIAKKTEKILKKLGYRVHLTRRSDKFLKLSQRTKIADKKNATVFISIHANSVPKSKRYKVHGLETYFLQNTRDARSQRIASRENAAVLKGAGNKLSKSVIIDSVLNGPKIIESNKLAIDVQQRIITNVRSKYKSIKDGGVRHAPFYVLVGASRPSILVEVGYISNPSERKKLFKSAYQNLIAKGIAEGINNYLNNRKREIDID